MLLLLKLNSDKITSNGGVKLSKTAKKHNFSTRGQLIVDLTVFFSGLMLVYLFFVSGVRMPPFAQLSIPWIALIPGVITAVFALTAFIVDDERLGYAAHITSLTTYQLLVIGEQQQFNNSLALVVVTLLFIGSNLSRTLAIIEVGAIIAISTITLFIDHPSEAARNHALLFTLITIIIGVFGVVFSRHFTGQRIDRRGRVTNDPGLEIDTVLANVNDGIVIINEDGIIVAFNPEVSRLTGWKTSDALGIHHQFILRFADEQGRAQDKIDNPIAIAVDKKTFTSSKLQLVTNSGSQVPVYLNITKTEMANQPSLVLVLRDITSEVIDVKGKSDFISTASHEMRTPIAAVEGYLALAMNPKVTSLEPKASELVNKAYESTRHLGRLFKDLLETTEVNDGRLKLAPEVINMNDLIIGQRDEMLMLIGDKPLKLSMYVDNQLLTEGALVPQYSCNVDPLRITEAIMNLFENAVKYTASGGIAVFINADKNSVVISVKDTGIGIPEQDIPHMFQKFYRVDNTATRTIGGTGLGLFITKSIVEQSDGSIWVESSEGSGSTFHIRLPRWDPITNSISL